MKPINIIRSAAGSLSLTCCLLLAASCQNNNIQATMDNEIRIGTTIDSIIFRAHAKQKITLTDLSLTVDYGASPYTHKNVKWTNVSGSWQTDSPMKWKNNSPAPVYAYAPYIDNVTDPASVPFSVQDDQSQGIETSDFLGFANPSCPHPDNTVQIEFEHQLSKMTINISFSNEFTPPYPAVETVSMLGCKNKFSYNPETQAITLDPHITPIVMHSTGTRGQYQAIVPPQTLAFNTSLIDVQLDNGQDYVYSTDQIAKVSFKKGNSYKMNLIVDKTHHHVLGSMEVESWSAGGDRIIKDVRPRIGDFVYRDGSYSYDFVNDPNNPVVGVVYYAFDYEGGDWGRDAQRDDTLLHKTYPQYCHGMVLCLNGRDKVNAWCVKSINISKLVDQHKGEDLYPFEDTRPQPQAYGWNHAQFLDRGYIPDPETSATLMNTIKKFSEANKEPHQTEWFLPTLADLWSISGNTEGKSFGELEGRISTSLQTLMAAGVTYAGKPVQDFYHWDDGSVYWTSSETSSKMDNQMVWCFEAKTAGKTNPPKLSTPFSNDLRMIMMAYF